MIAKLLEYDQLQITYPDSCETYFSVAETATIREALGIPVLTPAEVEVAQLEAELRQACAYKTILNWHKWQHGNSNWESGVQWDTGDPSKQGCWTETFDTELAAAQAAVEHVRTLRKPVLPKPEEMTYADIRAALHNLGWLAVDGLTAYAHRVHGCIWMNDDDPNERCFVERALREARRLDGAAPAPEPEPEKPKLPDVGSMGRGEMFAELHQRGWSEGFTPNGTPCWNGPSTQYYERTTQYYERDGATWTGTTRRALREARRLDGDAWGELSPAVGAG